MSLQHYPTQQLIEDISSIKQEITKSIENLNRIFQLIKYETEIISYEETYCKHCKEPCGRSNAEIFNCMMAKFDQKQTGRIKQYTKEYLEHDLQLLINQLEEKEKQLKVVLENIQKHHSYS
jgi:hypothetical protein